MFLTGPMFFQTLWLPLRNHHFSQYSDLLIKVDFFKCSILQSSKQVAKLLFKINSDVKSSTTINWFDFFEQSQLLLIC